MVILVLALKGEAIQCEAMQKGDVIPGV